MKLGFAGLGSSFGVRDLNAGFISFVRIVGIGLGTALD